MSFLTPIFLLLGLLSFPIILLYMLKLRRREVEISSTMLWQMVLRDRQANTPWQRLKRNWLLFLQLLLLLALILALARPAVEVPAVATGRVTVLLDASASMQATDVEPSRFAQAVEGVRDLINTLESGQTMTIILVGAQPQILTTSENDKTALNTALNDLRPTEGLADWGAAFALAAGAANASPGDTAQTEYTTVIISDGGLPTSGLPPLPGDVRYLPIGTSVDNVAISALSLRPTAQGAELFARVDNYGADTRTFILAIRDDTITISSQRIILEGGASRSIVLGDLPSTPAAYRAELTNVQATQPLDDFPLDDVAFAVFSPPNEGRTLLATPGNLFLEQLLSALPGIQAFRAIPNETGAFTIPSDPFDVYVFDGWLPDTLPSGNLLMINPPDNELFDVIGITDNFPNPTKIDHPLTELVDWDTVRIRQTRFIQPPAWADILINSDTTPLAFIGERDGRRIAVVGFDLRDSDLPLQIAYPILFAGLFDYLTPSLSFDAPDGLLPGEPLTLFPETDVEGIVVASPDNNVYALPLAENVIFADTDELGVYAITYQKSDTQQVEYFAVNLFAPEESDIRTAETLTIGSNAVMQSAEDEIARREFWPWLAAFAFLVLLIEWFAYHGRRTTDLRSLFQFGRAQS